MKHKLIGLACCGFLWAGNAFGNEPAPAAASTAEEWKFSVTPYFWAAGLSGKSSQFGLPAVDIDASFNDVFDNLDVGAMLIGEARRGRYSLFGDLMYTKISPDSATPRGVLAQKADLKVSTFAGLIGAGYSVFENASSRLDVVAGVRVWSVDTDLSLKGGVLDGRKRSDGDTWVDGLVGVRGNYAFTSRVYATGWGLVGAGGADVDWDVGAGIGYRINERFSATVGYRAVGVDYKKDGFEFDVVQKGPMAGVTIIF